MNIFTNISIFDWLGFFLGGVFSGAGVESIKWVINYRKEINTKKYIAFALYREINFNVSICDRIITFVKDNPDDMIPFHRFETKWIDVYLAKYPTLDNDGDKNLYDKLLWIKQTIGLIHDLFKEQSNYVTYGSVIGSLVTNFITNSKKDQKIGSEIYSEYIKGQNRNIAAFCKNLRQSMLKTPFSGSDYSCLRMMGMSDNEIKEENLVSIYDVKQ